MILELFCACLLLGWTDTTALADGDPAEAEWVATVRSVSMKPGQSWTLRLHGASPNQTSARLWWIEGPAAHTGFPAHLLRDASLEEEDLPDLIQARGAHLTTGECPALGKIAAELEELTTAPIPPAARPIDRPRRDFVLETPDSEPIDLQAFAPDHPAVRWANSAWDELSVCAGARTN